MGRMLGTVSMGIRAPIIREGDDLVKIITDCVAQAMESGEYDVTQENMVETLRAVRTFQQEYDYEALLAKGADYVPPADAETTESTEESEELPEAEDAAGEASE